MSRTILALDIAQSTGWAVWQDGRIIAHGTLKLTGKTPRDHARNLGLLERLLEVYSPDQLALEDVQFASSRDAHASYWRIRTLVELAWCTGKGGQGPPPKLDTVPTGTLKKWATGDGKAGKSRMCQEASRRVGVQLLSREQGGTKAQEDQADAILVALWAAELP